MSWFGLVGMSGEQIYRNFTEAPGAGELAAAADIVRGVQAEHEDEAASVRALAVRMESAWQGEAAGAAQRGAVPLAAEHEWGAPLFFTAQDLTARQVGSFGDARNGVVPVPPAPDKPSGWEIITSPTTLPTYERQMAGHNAAAQHNVDLMTGYEGASSFNGDNLPTSYGSIAPDSAGIAVQSQDNTRPDEGDRVDDPSGPRAGGPRGDGGGPGGPEWQPTGGSSGAPEPAASSSGGPVGQPPQETTPGGYVPPKPPPGAGPGAPGTSVPSGSGGEGALVGVPPVGFLPGGPVPGTRGPAGGLGGGAGGSDGGSGGRGGVGVPGGGRPGAGSGGEAGHGPGSRSGVGPPAGGAAAAEAAAARGGAGARGGGAGGVPMGMGAGRGRGGEDEERERPSWLIQPEDPEDTFGNDEVTAPPVIGHGDEDDK